MKLLSCHVENFGKLSGFSYLFEDDLNVLLAENGWGKSTFAAFLKVMFYGFDGENRRNEDRNERLRYKPWGGGTYGGTVTFSSSDRVYRMHRSFGLRKKEDSFLLYDDRTGLPSDDFTEKIGEELFGIDRDSFTRTVFWSQQDHETEATTLIQAKIGDLTAEQSDLPDYDLAIRRVRREMEKLSPDRASGQIRKKEARAAVLEAESARLPQLRRQLEESSAEQKRLAAELELIRSDRQAYTVKASSQLSQQEESGTAAPSAEKTPSEGTDSAVLDERRFLTQKLETYSQRLNQLRKARSSTALTGHSERKEYLKVRRERERMEEKASLALSRRIRTLQATAAAALSFSVLLLLMTWTDVLPLPFLIPAAVLVILALLTWMQSRQTASEGEPLSDELVSLREEETELRASLKALSAKMKKLQARIQEDARSVRILKAKIQSLPADSTGKRQSVPATPSAISAQISHDLAEFDRREEDCRQRLLRTEQLTADLRSQIRECRDSSEQLAALRKELTTLQQQYDTCVQTASFLEQARASFNSRYMNPFLRSFRRHYGMLTGESAENLRTDADFGISVLAEGLPRDPSLMSEGTRDLISLCRRMAMIDAMYPAEKPFLVLDDPFSNLDDERVKGGLRFLHNASFDYQILYLTCHESRV